MHALNHIHIKVGDARAAADWFIEAFGFRELTDDRRGDGGRLVRCAAGENGLRVNFSDHPGAGLPGPLRGPHQGIEHMAFDSADMEADVARLVALGAMVDEGPHARPSGLRVAFLQTPQGLRFELMQAPERRPA